MQDSGEQWPITRIVRAGPPRGRRAFTIVEVILAVAVMALAISTAITTMQRAFLALDSARNITFAAQIMQTELEKMRLKDWDTTINLYPMSPTVTTLTVDATINAATNGRFTLTREVTLVHTNMKKISYTVSWRGYDGRAQSRSYFTYYGKNGLYDFYYNSY